MEIAADYATTSISAFIQRWQRVTASELSTAQSIVRDHRELLDVPVPHSTPGQDYMFERCKPIASSL